MGNFGMMAAFRLFLAASLPAVHGSVISARQNQSTTAIMTFPPISTSTVAFNASATPTATRANTDFSDDALAKLWEQVGPVATGPITTTVELPTAATSSASTYAQPGAFHAMIPSTFDSNLTDLKLPPGFQWGVASSAYQIEGAAKDEGKGPSIWDLLAHRVPGLVADNSTGDVVGSHYWLYKQDIARLAELGIPRFSPSISWPRLFPFGKGPVNAAGVAHYDDVMRTMGQFGIKPAVTLFHWDTPLALFNEYGAWNNRQIVDDFFAYAKFVIERYDAYVDHWYTINEPQYCNWQFSTYPTAGVYYPAYDGVAGGKRSRFLCGHYTLLAHAKVAKWYHEEFKGRGRITFKNSGNYYEPADPSNPDDVEAAQRQFDFSIGWFGGPWTDGDYPKSLKDTLGDMLPTFTEEEKKLIKGSCDFYAIDPYTSYTAHAAPGGIAACVADRKNAAWPECARSSSSDGNGFPLGPAADNGVNWLYDTPVGVRRYLSKITKEMFPSVPDIVVSEFGFAEPFEGRLSSMQTILWDLRRADYYRSYLDNILAAIHVDGVNVTGAWGWAIFDNFEWFAGSSVRFGLQYVNYTSLERTPKASIFQFINWFKEHESSA